MPNPNPPRSAATDTATEALGPMFLSAEDFDATGILAGVEPCASNYWWIPELHLGNAVGGMPTEPVVASAPTIVATAIPAQPPSAPHVQAARRTSRRSTAA